jgi:hypothetical protein
MLTAPARLGHRYESLPVFFANLINGTKCSDDSVRMLPGLLVGSAPAPDGNIVRQELECDKSVE